MNRLLAILFWSVIAAAFIGPGTVTTAASAGAAHRYGLLWAVAFSTFACLALQEAAARLTIVSGKNLGEALRGLYPGGVRRWFVVLLVVGAVVLGCAAYEAGNILGATAGLGLALGSNPQTTTLGIGLLAVLILWSSRPRRVAQLLGVLVAVMGAAFLAVAVSLRPPVTEIAAGLLAPEVPPGAGLLVLGLVGTTVVPYNLFLGSGLAAGEQLGDTRFGLSVAVVLGGAITAAVVVVGSATAAPFSFSGLAEVLRLTLGPWGAGLFAAGLAAAGVSSAVTAPLAAAITARSLAAERGADRWSDRSWRFRAVWLGVVGVGVGFGVSGVRPVPAIILAQALNGILLPLATAVLLLAINDRRQMGSAALNGPISNTAMLCVLWVATQLGATNVLRAAAAVAGTDVGERWLLGLPAVVAAVLTVAIGFEIRRRRSYRGEPISS